MSTLSRRAFLGRGAAVGLGVAAVGVLGPARPANAVARTIACWGDSLTAGAGSGNVLTSSYPARLGVYADRTVYNGGRGGERSGGIAARQQGVPARTAVVRVTIPASGFVDVQFGDEVFFRTGPRSLVAGTLKGVAGEMARLGETGTTHRFTRTSPGAATDVPINTAFYPAAGPEYRGADVIIWAGHNDDYVRDRPPPYPSKSIEDNIAAMVAYTEFGTNPSNYLVLSLINGKDAGIDTTFYNRAIVEVNGNLGDTYPGHYLDVHRYLVDDALADAGITPTPQDRADIADDIPPSSLRAAGSDGHLNATGYDVLAKYIDDAYVSQRW